MVKEDNEVCPICKKQHGTRYCPDFHKKICSSCCGPRRSDKKCRVDHCEYGFEKIWIEDTKHGKVERRISRVPSKKDIISEIEGQLIAWCYKPCNALGGKTPIDISRTPEGKEKLIELINSIENKAKKTVRPTAQLVDYTIIKKELGLL